MGFGTGPDAPAPVVVQLARAPVGCKLRESGADMTGTPMQGLQWPLRQRQRKHQHQVCFATTTCRYQSLERTQKNAALPSIGQECLHRLKWLDLSPPLSLLWLQGKAFDMHTSALSVL